MIHIKLIHIFLHQIRILIKSKTLLFRNFSFSMSLMLFFIGLFLVIYFHNSILSKLIKEQLSVLVELEEPASAEDIQNVKDFLAKTDGVIIESIQYLDSKDAITQINKEFGQSMLLTDMENPFQSMILFNVSAESYEDTYLNAIQRNLLEQREVATVFFQNEIFDQINTNVNRIGIVFLVISLIFMFISIIILNNLIQLNMLSKRNEIRTMLLVGARVSYVRAPLINRARKEALKSWIIAVFGLIFFVFALAQFMGVSALINIFFIFGAILVMAIIALLVTMTSMYRIMKKYLNQPYYDQKLETT